MTAAGSSRRPFRDLLRQSRAECAERLAARAQRASHIAKVARGPRSRRSAYLVKSAALERGIELFDFPVSGDEQARPGLAVVHTGSHGRLHVRLSQLRLRNPRRPELRLRLHGELPACPA